VKHTKILSDAHMDNRLSDKFPLVSIIILNYNGAKYLEKCLKSVLATNYPNYEIILVDNASTDESLALIEYLFKDESRLIVIRNTKNVGFSEGNNIGIRRARGKYIVFLNNDTEVEPNWLIELIRIMEKDHSIGAAQSKLLKLGSSGIIDSTGDFVDFYGVAIQRGEGEKDLGQYENVEEIFSARGACMIVRREVLKKVGLFDPDFYLGYEDIDLCWRIRLAGYKIIYVPKSIVYHKGFGTPSNVRAYHGAKNRLLLMIKNYSTRNLVFHLPLQLLLMLTSFLLDAFVRKDRISAMRKLKVLKWLFLNIPHVIKKRQFVQSLIRKVSDNELKKTMLQSNLALYMRYILEVHRALENMERLRIIRRWYFSMTNPMVKPR
jgi:GT2 family glycosyltransferase